MQRYMLRLGWSQYYCGVRNGNLLLGSAEEAILYLSRVEAEIAQAQIFQEYHVTFAVIGA